MLKRIIFGIFLVLISVGLASAQSASISSGINWLVTNQNSDKSWGNASSSTAQFAASAEALGALRLNGNSGASFQDGLGWLNAQPLDSVNFTAKRILTKAQTVFDISDDLNRLISFKSTIDTNWGLDDDYSNDTLDTALALQALKAANYPDLSLSNTSLAFLTNSQHSDGGWGFTTDGGSTVAMTAVVASTLQQFPQTATIATALNKAASYLISHQNLDGGFGVTATGAPASSIHESALASIALAGSGQGEYQARDERNHASI